MWREENEAMWAVKADMWAFHLCNQNRVPTRSQPGSSCRHGGKGGGRVRGRVGGEGYVVRERTDQPRVRVLLSHS